MKHKLRAELTRLNKNLGVIRCKNFTNHSWLYFRFWSLRNRYILGLSLESCLAFFDISNHNNMIQFMSSYKNRPMKQFEAFNFYLTLSCAKCSQFSFPMNFLLEKLPFRSGNCLVLVRHSPTNHQRLSHVIRSSANHKPESTKLCGVQQEADAKHGAPSKGECFCPWWTLLYHDVTVRTEDKY